MHGLITSSSTQINLAYTKLDSLDHINHPNPQEIKKISIIHCSLSSLKGIQKFTALETLNLKFNNLNQSSQLFRISRREILKQLNLEGNQIQYFSDCTFLALKKCGFGKLVLLNNKDYSKWGKSKKKVIDMKQISHKLDQIQKSMGKTLKRVVRSNVIQKYKFANQIQLEESATSRSSLQQHTVSSYQRNQKTPLRQISLSNVNLIKSVRADPDQPQEKTKMPQLIIQPIQFGDQNQVVHMPLTQPTATFASQKQRQNMPFKGRQNYSSDPIAISEVDDNFTNQDEQIYETNQYMTYNNRQSLSRTRTITNMNKSTFEQMIEYTEDTKQQLALCFYIRSLFLKVLRSLKPRNMPRRVSYV